MLEQFDFQKRRREHVDSRECVIADFSSPQALGNVHLQLGIDLGIFVLLSRSAHYRCSVSNCEGNGIEIELSAQHTVLSFVSIPNLAGRLWQPSYPLQSWLGSWQAAFELALAVPSVRGSSHSVLRTLFPNVSDSMVQKLIAEDSHLRLLRQILVERNRVVSL